MSLEAATAAPRLLVTGAHGQVGWHLQRALAPLGEVEALGRGDLDLADLGAVSTLLSDLRPDIVVNAAAYTAVDKAESEPELAHGINVEAPAAMAKECAATGALLVHYSSDYVYDGSKSAPYGESDATGPLSVYGTTKLGGDEAIIASGCAHIILRTTWVYDIRGKNFLRTVLRLAREKDELRMVGDQFGAPTWARSIAEATALVLARALQRRSAGGAWPIGLFHLTAAGQTSWAGFAQAILEDYEDILDWPAETSEFGGELKARRVVEITTAQYKTAARRPRNSVLSNARIQAAFGIVMPEWRDQLRLALQDAIR
ncbi:MAG TPA: dTDP-4-dehydrorhamnose reductase [Terriglobales bacterium]|nr:dTDP-4-dehydrorhamnose reductase [Terriglobales bacterium]